MFSNGLPPLSPGRISLRNVAEQFRLKNVLPLLVLLTRLKRLIILPSDNLIALAAHDVANDVFSGRHIAFGGIAGMDIHDLLEEISFPVLTAEVLGIPTFISQCLNSISDHVRSMKKRMYPVFGRLGRM